MIKERSNKSMGDINTIMSLLGINKQYETKDENLESEILNSQLTKQNEHAMILFECNVISSLLFNAETWINIKQSECDELEKVQRIFIRRLFMLPKSTPTFVYHKDFGLKPIFHRINEKKLIYWAKIKSKPDDNIEKIIQNEDERLDYLNSRHEEIKNIFTLYNFDKQDIKNQEQNITNINQWKKIVKERINHKAEHETNSKISKKGKYTKFEKCKLKNYLINYPIRISRQILKVKMDIIDCRSNHKSSNLNLTCVFCKKATETTIHIFKCEKFKNQNAKYIECFNENSKNLYYIASLINNWEQKKFELKKNKEQNSLSVEDI